MEQCEIDSLIGAVEMLEGLDYTNIECVIDDITLITQSLIDLVANAQLKKSNEKH